MVHNDLHPRNIIVNPTTHEVKIIDYGLASTEYTAQPDVNENPAHDYIEFLWHLLYSWMAAPHIRDAVYNCLGQHNIVGPTPLSSKITGTWVDSNEKITGSLADTMPENAAFYPDEPIFTRYGHNSPMYPTAVIAANSNAQQGCFQGLLIHTAREQNNAFPDFLRPNPHTAITRLLRVRQE